MQAFNSTRIDRPSPFPLFMKIVIVGATGMIGGAILRRAISEPAITSIVALTRRALPEDLSEDTKTKSLTMRSFDAYPDDVLEKLKDAEICIWYLLVLESHYVHSKLYRSMGGRMEQFPDAKIAHLANVDYLLVAAKTFAEKLAPVLERKKFRFVYCSGAFTAQDPEKKLFFLADSQRSKAGCSILRAICRLILRRAKAENGLLEVERAHPDSFEVFIARPAGVLETKSGVQNMIYGPLGIGKGEIAYAMMDIALAAWSQGSSHEEFGSRARDRELLAEKP